MPDDEIIDLRDAQPISESVDTNPVEALGRDSSDTELVGGDMVVETDEFDRAAIVELESVGAPEWMIDRALDLVRS